MINTGMINLTTDINVVMNNVCTHKIILIGEADPGLVSTTDGVVGSVLLPPYKSMMYYADGNFQAYNVSYSEYLNSYECMKFINVLIKALLNNVNLLIYMTPDEYNIYFAHINMIFTNMGITIGDLMSTPSYVNPAAMNIISENLYMYELITADELYNLFPQFVQFSQPVVMKLTSEFRPALPVNTIEAYAEYFFNIKERYKDTGHHLQGLYRRV
ncbi:MAG: hypothetical protein ACRCXT_13115 [Paraclostridium sp.]